MTDKHNEIWGLINESHAQILTVLLSFLSEEDYSEDDFVENVKELDLVLTNLLELIGKTENKDFAVTHAEELSELFVNFDMLKETCDL